MRCSVIQRLALVGAVMFLAQPAFAAFMDGGLAGQESWEGQNNWNVTDSAGAGFASGGGSWQRARTFNAAQASADMTQGAQVEISAVVNVAGTLSDTNAFYSLGLAGAPEHTGANTPQVDAALAYDGSGNITAGGASVPYAAGEALQIDLVITRGANDTDWGLSTTLTNLSQSIVSSPSVSTPSDDGLDAHIVAGENSLFGMRMLNNADGRTINIDSVSISGPSGSYSTSFQAIPEPTAIVLLVSGLLGGALIRR